MEHTHPLHELCSTLTAEKLEEAEENLRQYVELALQIFERIRQDPAALRRLTRMMDREATACTASNVDADGKKFESSPDLTLSEYTQRL